VSSLGAAFGCGLWEILDRADNDQLIERVSADSVLLAPGALTSSTSAWRVHVQRLRAHPETARDALITAHRVGESRACPRTSRIALAFVLGSYPLLAPCHHPSRRTKYARNLVG
jgi:hypothetical protein